VDLPGRLLTVRDGKGGKDRIAVLPRNLIAPLRTQLERVRKQHNVAVAQGAMAA
jgi:hypothetical protein